jgi:hypothetical protein
MSEQADKFSTLWRIAIPLGVLLAVTALVLWNPLEKEYPKEGVDAFLADCRQVTKSSENECRCLVARFETSMPYEEFRRQSSRFLEGIPKGDGPEEFTGPAAECGILDKA